MIIMCGPNIIRMYVYCYVTLPRFMFLYVDIISNYITLHSIVLLYIGLCYIIICYYMIWHYYMVLHYYMILHFFLILLHSRVPHFQAAPKTVVPSTFIFFLQKWQKRKPPN